MILIAMAAGFGLLGLPAVMHRVGGRVRPRAWAMVSAAALFVGGVLVVSTVLLVGAPLAFSAIGLPAAARCCEGMVGRYRGAALVSTVALAVGLSVCAIGVRVWLSARRAIAHARAGSIVGTRADPHGSFDVIVLPDDRLYALSVPSGRRTGHVFLSRGIVDALSASELDLVCVHEAAHLRHGHRQHLVLALVVEEAFWFWPPARRSADTLRLALERWADEVAVGASPELRTRLLGALLAVAGVFPMPPLAAFGAVAGVRERLTALEAVPPRGHPGCWLLFVAPGLLLGLVALYAGHGLAHEVFCLLACLRDPHHSS